MELDPRYRRVPIAAVTATPNGLVNAYRDYWWIVTPDEELLKFGKGSWQCNPHREVVEHLAPAGCTVRQLPIVFIPAHPQDYAY